MDVGNRTADRKPHAHSLRLGRVEGTEQAIQPFRIDAHAAVLNGQQQMIGAISTRPYDHGGGAVAFHLRRLQAVEHQIDDDLL